MIWVALEVGATAWDVSVLCGAGGGSTVQADNTVDTTDSSAVAVRSPRVPISTPLSVSTGRRSARSCFLRLGPRPVAAAGGGIQLGLAHPHDLRCDLNAFVLGAELHGLFQPEFKRTSQRLHHIGG